jgi:hypothetical protein
MIRSIWFCQIPSEYATSTFAKRQLGRQHHPRRAASGDDNRMLGQGAGR